MNTTRLEVIVPLKFCCSASNSGGTVCAFPGLLLPVSCCLCLRPFKQLAFFPLHRTPDKRSPTISLATIHHQASIHPPLPYHSCPLLRRSQTTRDASCTTRAIWACGPQRCQNATFPKHTICTDVAHKRHFTTPSSLLPAGHMERRGVLRTVPPREPSCWGYHPRGNRAIRVRSKRCPGIFASHELVLPSKSTG